MKKERVERKERSEKRRNKKEKIKGEGQQVEKKRYEEVKSKE